MTITIHRQYLSNAAFCSFIITWADLIILQLSITDNTSKTARHCQWGGKKKNIKKQGYAVQKLILQRSFATVWTCYFILTLGQLKVPNCPSLLCQSKTDMLFFNKTETSVFSEIKASSSYGLTDRWHQRNNVISELWTKPVGKL